MLCFGPLYFTIFQNNSHTYLLFLLGAFDSTDVLGILKMRKDIGDKTNTDYVIIYLYQSMN